MLDAGAIVQGVASGYLTQKSMETLDKNLVPKQGMSQEELLQIIARHLENIDKALNPEYNPNLDFSFVLQPYPIEYVTDGDNMKRSHVSIFFRDSTPARFDIPGVGTYTKTVGPGWVQCDFRGDTRISTTDSLTHPVTISYRVDAIGVSL